MFKEVLEWFGCFKVELEKLLSKNKFFRLSVQCVDTLKACVDTLHYLPREKFQAIQSDFLAKYGKCRHIEGMCRHIALSPESKISDHVLMCQHIPQVSTHGANLQIRLQMFSNDF